MKAHVIKHVQIATTTHEVVAMKQQKIRAKVYENICTETYIDSYRNS